MREYQQTKFSNPLVITRNGVPIHLYGLHNLKNVASDLKEIQIFDKSQNLLFNKEVFSEEIISVDVSHKEVRVVYRGEDEKFLDEEEIDLSSLLKGEATISQKEILYNYLKNEVKKEMDFPKGSDKENAKHTELLSKANIDKDARTYIISKIRRLLTLSRQVSDSEIEDYTYKIYADLYGMGILQELDDDIDVGEIIVNGVTFPKFKADIYYYKKGIKYKYDKTFATFQDMKNVFDRAIEFNKKNLNEITSAKVEATRPNKDRVNIIIPKASENYIMNIRKFSNFLPNLEMMKQSGTVNDFIDKLMSVLVRGHANIGIGGFMGTGKTTFINFLLTYTDPLELKVVIASISETDVDRILKGHHVSILNVDEENGFTFANMISTALRTTADRIIIPESRAGEMKQVYEANQKTKGNLFTAHAHDADAFMDMCVDMYLSSPGIGNETVTNIRNKLSKAMDIVVVMRKVGDKIRIKSISEVMVNDKGEYTGMKDLVVWDFDAKNPLEGRYKRTEHRLSEAIKRRLNEHGVTADELEGL